jgi:6-phosphofructokinase 2
MADIVTLTMNPALDVSTSVERIEPVRKLRCRPERRDPGGGGINVARVAHRLGAETAAVFPAGGAVGEALRRLLEAEGVASHVVQIAGETRESFTALDETSGDEFRFVLPGPTLTAEECGACLETLSGLSARPRYLCASGSLPAGTPQDVYVEVAKAAARLGAPLVLDASGPALRAGLDAGVFMIKPNLGELRELTGEALADEKARLSACRRLIATQGLEIVALTLSEEGAMLVTAERAWRAPAIDVPLASSVGAGDSFTGALLWALAGGEPLDTAFAYGVAAGAAALIAPGGELAGRDDVMRLLAMVELQEIHEAARVAPGGA